MVSSLGLLSGFLSGVLIRVSYHGFSQGFSLFFLRGFLIGFCWGLLAVISYWGFSPRFLIMASYEGLPFGLPTWASQSGFSLGLLIGASLIRASHSGYSFFRTMDSYWGFFGGILLRVSHYGFLLEFLFGASH